MTTLLTAESPREEASAPEAADFEIVMGRRQIASVSLLVIVLLAVFSGASYVIGKSLAPAPAPKPVLEAMAATVPDPPPAPLAQATPAPAPAAAPVAATPELKADGSKPLYADPAPGSMYVQTGAVEKGVAVVIAEGLRTHGLDAFVAPGPSDRIYRVLIGPLPDTQSYQQAKQIVDDIGLATFARRYQQ